MREAMKPPKRSPLSAFHEYFGNRGLSMNGISGGREQCPVRRAKLH
jgi:hypothetical protein